MSALLLILGLILFVCLVVVHEFGHFLVATHNGVKAEEFGIGFPPRAWSKKLKNGTLFSLNWLPIGGFVRLKGEHDSDRSSGSYGAATLKTKTKIMTAGVGMNLLAGFVILLILTLVGMPKVIDNQFTIKSDTKVVKNQVIVGYVEPGSPADKAGLKERDELINIHSANQPVEKIDSTENLPHLTQEHVGQTIYLTVKHDGTEQELPIKLRSAQEVNASKNTPNPKGYLGVSPAGYSVQRYTWSAPIVALGTSKQIIWLTLQGLARLIGGIVSGHAGQATKQVAGPVGIFVLLRDASNLGYQFILFIIAVISLTLAVINILPIPALDGGRLFVTWLYRLLRRPLTKRTEEWIHGTGFALLMLLFVLITIVDIRRFF